jgi:uroporphyrinogen decarboxylase
VAKRLTSSMVGRLRSVERAARALAFQADAVAETRRRLPADKGLIGFVGGPWTLFVYATEGTHAGTLARAKASLDLYRRFARVIVPLLEQMIRAQRAAGADLVMVFDTAAGELAPSAFRRIIAPDLARLARSAPGRVGYFARGLHPAHLESDGSVSDGPWAGLGVDWRWDLSALLAAPDRAGFVQGNFDPALLRLTGAPLVRAVRKRWS